MVVAVVAPAPMAVMPTPMTTMPAPMAVVMSPPVMSPPVMSPAVMSPPHFLRCDPIGFVARGHRGMGIVIAGKPAAIGKRLRQQRRGLRACRQGGGARG